ncbi:MAG: magnesium transporter [Parcubacteria group bacterium]|nr:magnesium transporter [Parcubacteria group bacterium]
MEMNSRDRYPEEDVNKESIDHLIEHRTPWLIFGLLGGVLATLIVAKYEAILSADVRLAFFIPIIVYLSDALGTQTETIYVRALAEKKKFSLTKYVLKECAVGFGLGIISAVSLGVFSVVWLESYAIGLTVGLTMLINLSIAPLLALFIPNILYRRHIDPALGSGPTATIIQDLISLLVYFLVASFIIF